MDGLGICERGAVRCGFMCQTGRVMVPRELVSVLRVFLDKIDISISGC